VGGKTKKKGVNGEGGVRKGEIVKNNVRKWNVVIYV
tara:strand:+ start:530 stop:637 length:108 start_codon:yes stop_codon:yes gene_type:complete